MQGGWEAAPASAFEKDASELTVQDVYDISYAIGRDLLGISQPASLVSELRFKIVRVLEMVEALVDRGGLRVEELRMERDSLRRELDGVAAPGTQLLGPDKLVVDLKDPNRPRFTMEELKEVLQERNQLKVQLLLAQEELQLYKSGTLYQSEPSMVDVDLESINGQASNAKPTQEEKTTIRKLFSFTKK